MRALVRLIDFRNRHPAFGGTFRAGGEGSRLRLTWTRGLGGSGGSGGSDLAELEADLAAGTAQVRWTEDGQEHQAALADLPDLARL